MVVAHRYRYFPEVDCTLEGPFLEYWSRCCRPHILGNPISDVVNEEVRVGDRCFTVPVQYFKRGVLELHQEGCHGVPLETRIVVRDLGSDSWERKQRPDKYLAKLRSAFDINP